MYDFENLQQGQKVQFGHRSDLASAEYVTLQNHQEPNY